jgi:hypothetical protein
MLRVVFASAIVFILVGFSFAQEINGKWKGQMESPNGSMDLTFNFKTSGDTLKGTVESMMGELPISKGKIENNVFSFDVNAGEFNISHLCTFMGDSILMKVPGMQGDTMNIILKPVTELKKETK